MCVLLAVMCMAAVTARAATTAPLDPAGGRVDDRQALRVLLEQMEKSISALDIDGVLKQLHPDAVVTWQNAEVSRGHAQIKAYHERMIKGGAPIVKKFTTKATLGGPAVFYADSAVAYGTTVDTYELSEGLKFTLNANWSATLVKVDGQWKVAALHFSTNLFNNPLLNSAKEMMWIAAGIALVIGLIIGALLMGMRKKG
jgi:uncharacterized protein (TIGR02246 family)